MQKLFLKICMYGYQGYQRASALWIPFRVGDAARRHLPVTGEKILEVHFGVW